jgi:hypothetical protein
MRFHLGAIPTSPDFTPDVPWKPLREPSPWLAQFIAFPVGVLTAALMVVLWLSITPLGDAMFAMPTPSVLMSLAGLLIVHELVHAAAHPMAGRSAHSVLGFWPSRLVAYAHYDGELSRNRFVVIMLMPLFAISIVPLLVAAADTVHFWLGRVHFLFQYATGVRRPAGSRCDSVPDSGLCNRS